MKGTVEVESKIDVGSTFRVTLPLIQQEPSDTALPNDYEELSGQRILLVHPNRAARSMLTDHLAALGLEVESVAALPLGLDRLQQAARAGRAIALVMLDTTLPERTIKSYNFV